ncbi:YihY/virulence factor BrkB family protein [Ramlibacter rhizophilus]|uniref:YihY/virulence factor BrkB family protein n=1 Tax=Ramlibacter rhizophilus TaxID=1781167 RepID=A0A4Z0BKK9_9BURK|nr:YihY/virulence factor BrkB family protein [Ramlibacter rhizophilus]TFY98438.1 YihY/virulence factor BrkB family protein [Ramlibacter rhizophilus]
MTAGVPRANAVSLKRLKEAVRRIASGVLATPGLGVLLQAVRNYVMHQSANQAGSLAFSWVLAVFPLLILLSASAAYIGNPGDAAALVERVIGYSPLLVQEALRPVIQQVLAQRNQALLAIGIVITLWTGSSGLQAIRTALNRAYGIQRGMSFWKARLKVTIFTIITGTAVLVAFSSVVIVPYIRMWVEATAESPQDRLWLHFGVRYASAFFVLTAVYAVLYGWLPDVRQRLYTVLPGAVVGATLWVGAAATLSYTLRTAGKLALLYGGFAGVVATLVFLYISASTLIYGAEVNGVLRERGNRSGSSPGE